MEIQNWLTPTYTIIGILVAIVVPGFIWIFLFKRIRGIRPEIYLAPKFFEDAGDIKIFEIKFRGSERVEDIVKIETNAIGIQIAQFEYVSSQHPNIIGLLRQYSREKSGEFSRSIDTNIRVMKDRIDCKDIELYIAIKTAPGTKSCCLNFKTRQSLLAQVVDVTF